MQAKSSFKNKHRKKQFYLILFILILSFYPVVLLGEEEKPEATQIIIIKAPPPNVNKAYHQENAKLSEDLLDAIDKKDLSQVEKLVANGADVNAKKYQLTPLIRATIGGNKEVVEFL